MRAIWWVPVLTVLAAASADAQGRRWRQRDGADAKAKVGVHGGQVVKQDRYTFEVVVHEKWVRVYLTVKDQPIRPKGISGKVEIGIVRRNRGTWRGNHQTSSARLKVVKKSKKKGRLRSYLEGKHKLGKADRQALRVLVTLKGVPKTKKAVKFEVKLLGTTKVAEYLCPTGCAKGSFQDPGQCPKCNETLERKGAKKDARDRRARWRERLKRRDR